MNVKLIFKLNPLVIKYNNNDDQNMKYYINKLIEMEIPFVIENYKIVDERKNEILIKKLVEFTEDKERIKVSASLDNSFSGDAMSHSQLEMTLNDYLSYKGNLNLYLSQVNLCKIDNRLCDTLFYNKLEEIIYPNEFERINIWHSYKRTLSKFHYDSYENFIFVLSGVKVFSLARNNSRIFKSGGIGENTSNQCKRIQFKRSNEKIEQMKKEFYILNKSFISVDVNINVVLNYIEFIKSLLKYFTLELSLVKGQGLYIPEAMWHQVDTIGHNNMAINFWWSKANKFICNNKEEYFIKLSLTSLLEKKINEIYKKNHKKFKPFSIQNLEKLLTYKEKFISKIFDDEKLNTIKWVVIYYQFEKSKIENREFFEKFWETLNEFEFVNKFMQNINKMKNNLIKEILHSIS